MKPITQPVPVTPDDDEFPDLSTGARLLYRIIRDYARGKDGRCWLAQEKLVAMIGKCERQVRRYIRQLQEAGLIQARREGLTRTNRYWPTNPEGNRTPMSDQDRTPMSDQDRTPMSDQDRTPMSDHTYRSANGINSSSAAADPVLRFPKTREAREALEALGMPTDEALRFARRDAGLCLAAAPYFEECLTDPTRRKPISNPVGFMRSALIDPKRHGFARQGGCWLRPAPAGEALRVQQAAAKQQARQDAKAHDRQQAQAERAETARRRAADEAWWAHWVAVWEGLPESARQEIRALVRRRYPLFAATDDENYRFKSQCLRELERRHGGG